MLCRNATAGRLRGKNDANNLVGITVPTKRDTPTPFSFPEVIFDYTAPFVTPHSLDFITLPPPPPCRPFLSRRRRNPDAV